MSPSRGNFFSNLPILRPTFSFTRCRSRLRRSVHSAHKSTAPAPPSQTKLSSLPAKRHPDTSPSVTPATPATLTPTSFSSYSTGTAPSSTQLHYAHAFFTKHTPAFLFSSPHFRTLPRSSAPEVAFFGRSNVGKSSLLNALLQRSGTRIAHVSSKPGRTRMMNAFGVGGEGGGVKKVAQSRAGNSASTSTSTSSAGQKWIGRGGVVVLDMPGYGKASREEWGIELEKYLAGRKQLRRVFLLIDAAHGAKPNDITFLRSLHALGVPFQVVLSKVDRLVWPKAARPPSPAALLQRQPLLDRAVADVRAMVAQVTDSVGRGAPLVDVLACSTQRYVPASMGVPGGNIGIDGLRWAVLAAAGLECDERGRRRGVGFAAGEMLNDEGGDGDGDGDEEGYVVQAEPQRHAARQ